MGRIVKCVAQSGFNIRSLLSSRGACSTASCLDTHAVVKGLEAQGIPPNQSEALLKVLNETFVSKSDIHKSAELSDAQLSALKWEMKSLQENQLLALHQEQLKIHQEQLKMQSELELKVEKLDMGIEMKVAELRALLEARMVALTNESDKGFCELNGRINASDAKWTAALEGTKAEIEGARYEVIKYCVGAFMFGGFVVGVMTHAYDAIKY